jgi:outer membrane protein assembly factor BamB
MTHRIMLGILVTTLATDPGLAQEGARWEQWRGPTRDGQFSGSAWPDALADDNIELLWRVDGLGPSYCGPIVTENTVFTAETRDKKLEIVRAFDRASGEQLWETAWEGSMSVPFFAAKNGSWIRSTPAFDGERLYVAGMQDVLVCIAGATGEVLWRIDFVDELGSPPPDFGFVCSPLVTDQHVYVQAGGGLCKLDKLTGDLLWRSMADGGGMMGSAFSSPILTELDGVEQLVVLSRTHMNGIDPAGGEVLWRYPVKAFRGMNILTPLISDEAVFTATYGGRSQLLDVSMADGSFSVTPRWNSAVQGYMTSPVAIEGHAYFFNRSNRFACVSLSDGEIAWISPPTGDNYWSLVAQGNRILALNDTGLLRLLEADPKEYSVLGKARVADAQTWAHVAVVDSAQGDEEPGTTIVVREQTALSLHRWR